jgi:hypothetical protein
MECVMSKQSYHNFSDDQLAFLEDPPAERVPPPLGDVTTRRLVASMLLTAESNDPDRLLAFFRLRGATVEDVRQELQRRETVGVVR